MSRFFPQSVPPAAFAPDDAAARAGAAPPGIEFLGSMPNLPFSEAVRVGHLLFLSGQIGIDWATGKLVEGGIQEETRQALTNIRQVVEKYGSRMDHVVKCTIMLADIREWPAMNEIYATFFPGGKPARSAFAGSGLALDARVEIECIAAIEQPD
jgi:2-iminobutanoate/2-iminopropanoate deaminase